MERSRTIDDVYTRALIGFLFQNYPDPMYTYLGCTPVTRALASGHSHTDGGVDTGAAIAFHKRPFLRLKVEGARGHVLPPRG